MKPTVDHNCGDGIEERSKMWGFFSISPRFVTQINYVNQLIIKLLASVVPGISLPYNLTHLQFLTPFNVNYLNIYITSNPPDGLGI